MPPSRLKKKKKKTVADEKYVYFSVSLFLLFAPRGRKGGRSPRALGKKDDFNELLLKPRRRKRFIIEIND